MSAYMEETDRLIDNVSTTAFASALGEVSSRKHKECRSDLLAHIQGLHALCEEMGEALNASRMPLDLYSAYGWPDRACVRSRVNTALAKWKESK